MPDPKTIEVLELRVGYVKARFGKLCRQDIKRPDVLAFMRSYEAEGKLETRDRVRSIDPEADLDRSLQHGVSEISAGADHACCWQLIPVTSVAMYKRAPCVRRD